MRKTYVKSLHTLLHILEFIFKGMHKTYVEMILQCFIYWNRFVKTLCKTNIKRILYILFNAAFLGIDFAKLCVKHMFKEYCIRCCIYWNAFCKKDESIFQIRLDLTSRNVLRSSTFNFYIKKELQELKTILNVRIPETSAQRKY